jgi:hypothetical protein
MGDDVMADDNFSIPQIWAAVMLPTSLDIKIISLTYL